MRIAYICTDPGIAVFGTKGASVHIQEVVREMLSKGHDVTVFTVKKGTEVPADLVSLQIEEFPLPNGLKTDPAHREIAQLEASNQIAQRIASESFDLVYERYSLFSAALAGVKRLLEEEPAVGKTPKEETKKVQTAAVEASANKPGVRTILEVNAPLIDEQRKHRVLVADDLALACLRTQVAAADAVICVSDPVRAWVVEQTGCTDNVHTVSNGVNLNRIQVQPEAADPVVTFVGTLKPWHGVADLLAAVALKKQPWKLRIIGSGPEEASLRDLAAQLGIEVEFLGAVAPEQLPASLAGSAIGVAPYPQPQNESEHYFSPLKIYEYLAAGLAVVATDVADIPQMLSGCGVVVPASNPEALAKAIDQLVENPQMRKELQVKAREEAEQKHSWGAESPADFCFRWITMNTPKTVEKQNGPQNGANNSRSDSKRTLKLVWTDLKTQLPLVTLGVLALLLEVAFRVLEPWPLKIVIDNVLPQGYQQEAVATLFLLAGLLVGTVILRAVSNYLATVCFALVGSKVAASLRTRAFGHVQSLDQQFHARNRSADTVQRIVSDVSRLQDVAITAGLPLVANVATLLVMAVVMVVLDPLLALIVVVAVLFFFAFAQGSSQKISAASKRSRRGEGQLANTAQESLTSIKVVQTYGLEDLLADRFAGANQSSLQQGVKSLRLSARLERSTDVLVGLAAAAVIVGGGLRVMTDAMTVGELVLFSTYLRTTMKPLRDMAKYTGRIAKASASGERVADLLDTRPQIISPQRPAAPQHISGQVAFSNVVTHYEGHPVLQGVTLTVNPQEYVAVIGPSGAGKSTLVSLLTRAQDPSAGVVSLDGLPLGQFSLENLRSQVAVLHQEAVLFTGTIRENIRLGRFDATDAEVEAAARAAFAEDFILAQPQGYETLVGERGGTLSGGQRQRIAIARALLRDAPVVVLDEATTGLDPESATQVLDAIDALVANRTTLAVTHDAEVVRRASRVIWLEAGRVKLDGSVAQLLVSSAEFRQWMAARADGQVPDFPEGTK